MTDIPPTAIWWSRAVLCKVIMTLAKSLGCNHIQMHFPLTGNITFSIFSSFYHPLSHRSDNPPQMQQVNCTMLLTQITHTVLYKHSALLSHCLCFCIIPPNVCKFCKDYFCLRRVNLYVLPLAVYCGGQDQYYIRSSWHWVIPCVTLTFMHSLTPPDKKWKNVNLNREKVFEKACKSAHVGFWYANHNALC